MPLLPAWMRRRSDIYSIPADVIVYKDGDYAVAVNSRTKQVIDISNDHADVIQKAINSLPSDVMGKIYISGDLTVKERVSLRSNIILHNDGRITGDLLDVIFYGDGLQNVVIIGNGWIRQSKVNIYGQANGNFNTTYQCIRIDNSKNIYIDHEVGGFSTTSDTDSRPKGPSWAIHITNSEKIWLKLRASYSLEHVLVSGSKHVLIDAIVEKSYDSSIWILQSDNVNVRAVIDLTDVPCCANGLEINTSRNVNADVVVYNPPVNGVWLYFDPNAGQEMYNINVRASVYGGAGRGINAVENGDPTKVYNIHLDVLVEGVGGNGLLLQGFKHGSVRATVKDVGGHSVYYVNIHDVDFDLRSINPTNNDLHDYYRDNTSAPTSDNLRLKSFYSDKYSCNVVPSDWEYPYKYTLFLKDYSVAAGSIVSILPLNARTNVFLGKIGVVYNSNSNIYVQLYNTDTGIVQNEDNVTGNKNWNVWWSYNYQIRLRNSDTVNTQSGDILIEVQSIKPLW